MQQLGNQSSRLTLGSSCPSESTMTSSCDHLNPGPNPARTRPLSGSSNSSRLSCPSSSRSGLPESSVRSQQEGCPSPTGGA
jgi:hypothetical protein